MAIADADEAQHPPSGVAQGCPHVALEARLAKARVPGEGLLDPAGEDADAFFQHPLADAPGQVPLHAVRGIPIHEDGQGADGIAFLAADLLAHEGDVRLRGLGQVAHQILEEGAAGGDTHPIRHPEDALLQQPAVGQFLLQARGQAPRLRRGGLDPPPEDQDRAGGDDEQGEGGKAGPHHPRRQRLAARRGEPAVQDAVIGGARILARGIQILVQGRQEVPVPALGHAEIDLEGVEHHRGPLDGVARLVGVSVEIDGDSRIHLAGRYRREEPVEGGVVHQGAADVEPGAEGPEVLAVDVAVHDAHPPAAHV